MADYYVLKVPVKKHLQKFIHSQEGFPINNREQSFVWHIIRPYLQYKVLSGHRYDDINKSFPGYISINIPKSNVRVYGIYPRMSTIGFINKVLSMHFGRELSFYVTNFLTREGRYRGYNSAIESFCQLHNIIIEEDISLDALKKMEFRYRKKR